jgi:hypothetical protein
MKSLKRLGAAMSLTSVLAFTAFADCPSPIPGEMNTPPCTVTNITPDDPTARGEISTIRETTSGNAFSVSMVTAEVLLNLLSML